MGEYWLVSITLVDNMTKETPLSSEFKDEYRVIRNFK